MSKGSGPKMFTIKLRGPLYRNGNDSAFKKLEKELGKRESETIHTKSSSLGLNFDPAGTHVTVKVYDLGDGVKITKEQALGTGLRSSKYDMNRPWRSHEHPLINIFTKISFCYSVAINGKTVENTDEARKLIEKYTGIKLPNENIAKSGYNNIVTYKLSTETSKYTACKK